MANHSPDSERSLKESTRLKGRAIKVIPGCSQTKNKSPRNFVQGVVPAFIDHADGATVWDVDGNEYIDCHMALGPVILGHNHPVVSEAVREQLQKGPLFTLPHPLEVEVAEQLVEMISYADMVRFAKNGNDVTTMAVRLARAATGRDIIATTGYHGWQDWSVVANPGASKGVPGRVEAYTESFTYNEIESLERIFEDHPDNVAAIVMTPTDIEPPKNDFLKQTRELADENEAILVFDEILTGFRFGPSGAGGYFDIDPDLACFAKAMANGFPIAALVGRRELLTLIEHDDLFISTTYGGETISLAAAQATLSELASAAVADHIWNQGQQLRDGMNDLALDHGLNSLINCRGSGPITRVEFTNTKTATAREIESLFQQEAIREGVLFTGTHLLSYAHNDRIIDAILRAYDEAMGVVAKAINSQTVASQIDGSLVGSKIQI